MYEIISIIIFFFFFFFFFFFEGAYAFIRWQPCFRGVSCTMSNKPFRVGNNECENNLDSDQPVHLRSLKRV